MLAGLIDSSKVFVIDFRTLVGTQFRTKAKKKNKKQKNKKD